MQLVPVTVPQLGNAMEEVTVAEWYVEVGERVQEGDPIVMIDSEKAQSELEAPATGTIHEIVVPRRGHGRGGRPARRPGGRLMDDLVGRRHLGSLLEENLAERPDVEWLVFEDRDGARETFTFRAFDEAVARLAAGLRGLDVTSGTKVVVHLRNCPELLVAYFAIMRLGGVVVPNIVANLVPETEHVVSHSDAEIVITSAAYAELFEAVLPRTPGVRAVVMTARDGQAAGVPYDDLAAAAPLDDPPAVASEDRRGDDLHLGDHRAPEGRHAHARQPAVGGGALRPRLPPAARRPAAHRAAALPRQRPVARAAAGPDRRVPARHARGVLGRPGSGARSASTARRSPASWRCCCARSWPSRPRRTTATTRCASSTTRSTCPTPRRTRSRSASA